MSAIDELQRLTAAGPPSLAVMIEGQIVGMVKGLRDAGLEQQRLPDGLTFSPERITEVLGDAKKQAKAATPESVGIPQHVGTRTARAAIRGARKILGW